MMRSRNDWENKIYENSYKTFHENTENFRIMKNSGFVQAKAHKGNWPRHKKHAIITEVNRLGKERQGNDESYIH